MLPARILPILAQVQDPRVARTRAHKLVDVLMIALLASINGANGWDEMADFGKARESWLRGFLDLPNRTPSADTFRRIFESLDPQNFARCIAELTSEYASHLEGQVVAIDGKTMRGSRDRSKDRSPLHVVRAWVAERGITSCSPQSSDRLSCLYNVRWIVAQKTCCAMGDSPRVTLQKYHSHTSCASSVHVARRGK